MPPGAIPPLIMKYSATSVPIMMLAMESDTLSEQQLFDYGVNFIRSEIATIPGAQSGYVGLGSVEARLGNTRRAQEVTEQFAAIPDRQRVRDPWWSYRTTRVPVGDLTSPRKAVRQ